MTCKKMISEISNFLDNELDASLRIEFEEHMSRCPGCKVIVDTTLKTIQIYRGTEPYPLPSALHERLEKALRRQFEAKWGSRDPH